MMRWLVAVAVLALARGPQALGEPAGETLRATLDPALQAYRPSSSVAGDIRTGGNLEHMEPLMKLWIAGFTKVQPHVRFSLSSEKEGSGKSIPALLEGKFDISLMGREMKAKEGTDFEQKYGYKPFVVVVAGGSYRVHGKSFAPRFIVNKANPIDRLSLAQLDAIYSKTRKRGYQETITTWGQLGLGGEWAKKPIAVYGLKPVAGTAVFLRDRLLQGGQWREGIKEVQYAEEGFDEMVDKVAHDPTAIGFATFAHANPNVKTLALAEKAGGPYSQGTFEDVASHRYPLSRFVFISLNRAPGKPIDPKVKEFLKFVLSRDGQAAVLKEGEYLPIPADIVRQERAKLE
jgi:phosphate transport system substrate-binding protein